MSPTAVEVEKFPQMQALAAESDPVVVPQDGKYLVVASCTNLFQTIVGSGLLALPYAFFDGGVGLGTVNIALMGTLSMLGFLAVGQACNSTGARTYREAWLRTVGSCEAAVDIAIFLETSIIMASFMILLIDYLGVVIDVLLGISVTTERGLLAMVVTVPILLPLSLQPRLHNLRFSSALGNCAVSYTIFFVIIESLFNGEDYLGDASFLSSDTNGIFRATSVMASAYISHYNAPDIFAELASHPRQWHSFVLTVIVSFGSVALLYGAFAVAGYARFGPEVKGNVLLNYGMHGSIMVAWISMLPTLVASFALHLKPARDALARSIGLELYRGQAEEAEDVVLRPFVMLSVGIVAAVVLWGVFCTDISWILAFRGALLAFNVSFVMPGLMLLNCPNTGSSRIPCQRACGYLLVISGVANSLLGLYCVMCL